MYQAVFLDAGNTLFHTRKSRQERIIDALERCGLRSDSDEIEAAIEQVRSEMWDSPLWPLTTREKEDRWWRQYYTCFLDYVGEDFDLADPLAQETLYVHYVEAFSEVEEVLETLRGEVKLGVISNAFPSLSEALDKLELTRYFDHVVNSSIVDVWKPDERIYQIALERLDVAPSNAIFVDDLEENIAAAEDLGLTALLIDRWEKYPDTPHRRVTDLYPIVDLVTK